MVTLGKLIVGIGILLVVVGLVIWFALVYVLLFRWMRILTATNQGRLLFPAIPAISLGLVVGWWGGVRAARPVRWAALAALGGCSRAAAC